jgi:hypothetical protein
MRKRGKGWQADVIDELGKRVRLQFKTKKEAAEFESSFKDAQYRLLGVKRKKPVKKASARSVRR